MERSGVFTFQVSLPKSGAIASPGIPGLVQILFADVDRGVEKTLEHRMNCSFASSWDCDQLAEAQAGGSPRLSDIRSDMIAAGMTEVGEAPTDEELRVYYASYAPAHEAIRENRFAEAAAMYSWLAIGASELGLRDRYTAEARQLDIAHQIRSVCHRKVSFPPTGAEVEAYFLALAKLPVSEIQIAFQKYADAFYVQQSGAATLSSVEPADADPQQEWCTQIPVSWEGIQRGKLNHDSRRLLDSVGFALLGQKCLKAAGFSTGQFAVASRRCSYPQTDSLSTFIMMFTSNRTLIETRRGSAGTHTEVVVVSNGTLQWTVAREFVEIEAAEELLLWSAFQTALGVSMDRAGRVVDEQIIRHQELAQTFCTSQV